MWLQLLLLIAQGVGAVQACFGWRGVAREAVGTSSLIIFRYQRLNGSAVKRLAIPITSGIIKAVESLILNCASFSLLLFAEILATSDRRDFFSPTRLKLFPTVTHSFLVRFA
jgi:hypothetical protein